MSHSLLRVSPTPQWKIDAKTYLSQCLTNTDTTSEHLFEILWEYYILRRISPSDHRTKKLRLQEGRAVWAGNLEDPAVYARILYATEAVRCMITGTAVETIVPKDGWVTAALGAFNEIVTVGTIPEFLWPQITNSRGSFASLLLDEMTSRARRELSRRGAEIHDPLIPIGGRNGKTIVQGYTVQGMVLATEGDQESTILNLCPSKLKANEFKL